MSSSDTGCVLYFDLLYRVSVRRRGDREHALRQKVQFLSHVKHSFKLPVQIRPLDSTNAKKLNNIRDLFLRVDQRTR